MSITDVQPHYTVANYPRLKLVADSSHHATERIDVVAPMSFGQDRHRSLNLKFRRPRFDGAMLPRPRLFALLSELRAVTLVSAPAGYGKSVLVSTWLETQPLPYAWLTLDVGHSQPLNLAHDILAATSLIAPELSDDLGFEQNSSPTVVANDLVERLRGIKLPMILVLDNYDLVDGEDAHLVVSALLRRLPSAVYLIVITRRDPPLSMAGLRAHGRLTEVRTNALSFSRAETVAFLQSRLQSALDDALVSALQEHTEGWGAGLQLAIFYLRELPAPRVAFDRLLHTSNPYALEYLMTEVLQGLPPAIGDFLIRTSMLPRLNLPLCAAVVDDPALARKSLHLLSASNLLFGGAEGDRGWRRTQRMLRHELRTLLRQWHTQDEIRTLHARAGAWFAAEGMIDDALHHITAAGDAAAGARLVAEHRHDLMSRDEWPLLQQWAGMFERTMVGADPDLSLLECWLLLNLGHIGEATTALERIDRLLAQGNAGSEPATQTKLAQLRAEADVLRSELLLIAAQPDAAIEVADAARQHLPHEWQVAWSHLLFTLACAHLMQGRRTDAHAILDDAMTWPHVYPSVFHVRVLAAQCQIQWIAADLSAMLRTVQLMILLCEQLQLAQMRRWAAFYLGSIYYQWNELDRAEETLRALVEEPSIADAVVFATASCALAATYQAQGRSAEARHVVDSAIAFLRAFNHPYLTILQAYAVELALRQGDVQRAAQWVVQQAMPAPRTLVFHSFAMQLTRPKVLIALRQSAARRQAAEMLAQQRAFLAEIHSTRFLVDALLLEVLLHDADGNRPDALAALEQALRLAYPGNLVRVFVDAGAQLLPLLDVLAADGVTPTFARTISAAIWREQHGSNGAIQRVAREEEAERTPRPLVQESLPPETDDVHLVEPLTQRELDVLAAMAQYLTTPEIALELGITAHTVKHHIGNILGKLQSSDRREAIARASRLGLLGSARRQP